MAKRSILRSRPVWSRRPERRAPTNRAAGVGADSCRPEPSTQSGDQAARHGKTAPLPAEISFLTPGRFAPALLDWAAAIARGKNIDAAELLIQRGYIPRGDYERLLAERCGAIAYRDYRSELRVVGGEEPGIDAPYAICDLGERDTLVIAPRTAGYRQVAELAQRHSTAFSEAVFVDAPRLRHAIFDANANSHIADAERTLRSRHPDFSAARRLDETQALMLLLLIAMAVWATIHHPQIALLAGILAVSIFFLGVVVLRTVQTVLLRRLPPSPPLPQTAAPEDHPHYSILVALYREAEQVAALTKSLQALDWPSGRREILLICEAGDRDTISAIQALELPEGLSLLICPPGLPRTKPRALMHALKLCTGSLTVIYDAEDRPHPQQLIEAWTKFQGEGPELACVQAPLVIDNKSRNWLCSFFDLEYRIQFFGNLPVLAWLGAPLPLGGTSNHFRTDALRACGGWDPYNVTEDADLGIRLARMGWRCGVIGLPTFEEAPERIDVWFHQRTRWLKGWMQTVLVHSRQPFRAMRELGFRSTLLYHLVVTAIVVSMLAHPLFMAIAVRNFVLIFRNGTNDAVAMAVAAICVFNLVGGYSTWICFAKAILARQGARASWTLLLSLPAYWLLISIAGWRAFWQLVVAPFHWEKTRHGLAKRRDFADIVSKIPRSPISR